MFHYQQPARSTWNIDRPPSRSPPPRLFCSANTVVCRLALVAAAHPAYQSIMTTMIVRHAGRFLSTPADIAAAIARVSLGLILFPHGAQHALGWFGGYGFAGTHAWMTGTLGFPAILAAVAIVTELIAPIALILGLAGRAAALGTIGIM